jgi:hypothetical protein
LSAQPSPEYLIYTWLGVNTQTNDMAQITADSYHAVEVKLIPQDGVPAIQAGSIVAWPNGRVQFAFTAGAGLATEATVWGATKLSPPDWEVLATVPLIDGQGVFTDDTVPAAATRFYRVTLP